MIEAILAKTNYFIFSIILFGIGIAVLIGEVPLFKSVVNIVLLIMILISIKECIQALLQRKKKNKLYESIVDFFFLLILFWYQDLSLAIVPMGFGLYLIINGLVKLVSYLLMRKDHVKNRISTLLLSVLFLTIGILLLFAPLIHLRATLIILGIYCLLLGSAYFTDFLDQVKPDRPKWFSRRIRVTLPAFVDAFIPYTVMNRLNHLFNQSDEIVVLEEKKSERNPDLEIFIHVSAEGNGKFGHADLYFEGELISYGGYDKNNRIFHDGIGSGVLFITSKEKYIPFCIQHSKKTLFGFGFKLTERQKVGVRKKIKQIKDNLVSWDPSLLADQKAGKEIYLEEYNDYVSLLYLATHASFYKFKTGRYRSYFVLGTNCVSLMDSIIGPTGIDLLKLNGIITPGTYYEYLNNEFLKKGSSVICKTIYNELYLRKSEKMDYKLLQYPSCSTCKKAKMWLDMHSVEYEDRNIVLNVPTQEELKQWIDKSGKPIRKFFNTSGLYYKQMNLKDKLKTMSEEEMLFLLSSNGMLIKRPLLIGKDFVKIGFKEKEWEEIIK